MSSAEALTSLVSDGRTELREGYADVGDEVRLHYVEAGDGPLARIVREAVAAPVVGAAELSA